MSKANNPIKVLKTAIKRINKGWDKGNWVYYDKKTGKASVCLEGAIYGYCTGQNATEAQKKAIRVVEEIIGERTGSSMPDIPSFNDAPLTTKDDILEVCKLAIIRLETGGALVDDPVEELIPAKR